MPRAGGSTFCAGGAAAAAGGRNALQPSAIATSRRIARSVRVRRLGLVRSAVAETGAVEQRVQRLVQRLDLGKLVEHSGAVAFSSLRDREPSQLVTGLEQAQDRRHL